MLMYTEKKFIKNYLTQAKSEYGQLAALFFLLLCIIFSYLHWHHVPGLAEFLTANKILVFEKGEYWRLFTTSLVHGDIKHLGANSLMLFILIYFVTSFYGVINSLLISFLMGGIINAITISFYSDATTLVGASGILYYLWGFWLVLFLGIETQRSIWARLVRVLGIFFILLVPTSFDPQTSYTAHYVGLGLGMAWGTLVFALFKNYFKSFEKWEIKVTLEDEEELPAEFIENNDNIQYH